ncbi:signal peptidase II [Candidatus Dojkabacteria bacterium]|nr:signal peptidase II [Candidatus Dojkabacteria bacterium]
MRSKGTIKRTLWEWILLFTIIFIDQTVKLFVTINEKDYVLNKGVAFGIFGKEIPIGLLLNLFGVILTIFMIKLEDKTYLVPLLILLGAGLSNLIDRVLREGVVDYINIGIIPSFNIADLLITTSLIIVTILFIKNRKSVRNTN